MPHQIPGADAALSTVSRAPSPVCSSEPGRRRRGARSTAGAVGHRGYDVADMRDRVLEAIHDVIGHAPGVSGHLDDRVALEGRG